jgi:hypothetical protein
MSCVAPVWVHDKLHCLGLVAVMLGWGMPSLTAHRALVRSLEEMTCTLYDGSTVQALGFTTHPCSRTCPTLGFAHPSERYLQIVRVGIAASGIDSSYQNWLQELQPYRCAALSQLSPTHDLGIINICWPASQLPFLVPDQCLLKPLP